MGKKAETKVKIRSAAGDMTSGTPWKKLIVFAVPILLSSLLQQLYNAADAVIVGQFVGPDALGAIGSSGTIVQLLIALFMGLASGTCVVVANYFGKKDSESLSKTVHTAMLLSVIAGAVVAVLGVLLSPMLLRAMNTPESMMADATSYIQIFFSGMIFLAIYNMGASVFQAVGNSKFPLYFLAATTVLNVIGDMLFVAVFKMGVAGAALATIISEAISAALILVVMFKSKREYKLSFNKLKIDKTIAKRVFSIGLPGAIQQSIVSISNIMVWSYINGLGTQAVSGYTTENKLDAFLPLPISAMAIAITTFVGQNLGAGEEKRARKGVWAALTIGAAATGILSILVALFHDAVFGIFSTDQTVIDTGWQFGLAIVPFYVFLAGTSILPGALRGAGNVKFATFTCVICFVVVRQIYLLIVTNLNYSILTVALCYPITWGICAAVLFIYYLSKNRISNDGLTRVHLIHTDGSNTDFFQLCNDLDEFQNANVPGREQAGLSSVYNLESLEDVFLLYDGPKVIGSAGLWRHDDETCEVVRMYVNPKYRSRGYAATLISEVEKLAKSLGYKQIHMRTFNTLPEVQDYEKDGFAAIPGEEFKYVDKYPPALLLAPLRLYMKRDLI